MVSEGKIKSFTPLQRVIHVVAHEVKITALNANRLLQCCLPNNFSFFRQKIRFLDTFSVSACFEEELLL
jgi:hypothetical protein